MKASFARQIRPPRLPKHLRLGTIERLQDHAEYAELVAAGSALANQQASHILFEQVHLKRAGLNQTRLAKLRIIDARFETCDVSAADWEQARFRRVELLGCRLLWVKLPKAMLENVLIQECNAQGAVFASATFRLARFDQCNLRQAVFEEADLAGVVFHQCDLTEADLRGAKLNGADLRGSIINGAQVGARELEGAIIDSAQAIQVAGLLGITVREACESLDP